MKWLLGSASELATSQARLLHDLGHRARELDESLNEAESLPADEIELRVVQGMVDLSRQARTLFEQLLATYEVEDGHDSEMAGLLFCALAELRSREEAFRRAGTARSSLDLIAACGSILRNLKRALTAVQVALCERHGLRPTLNLHRELELALEVRTAYAKFHREIESIRGEHEPDKKDAGPALQSAATSIAMLTGRDIFSRLRPQDREYLRALQQRILAWRTAGGGQPIEARRLWQDLYAFTQLIQAVNRRQELLEYDQQVSLASPKACA